MKPQEAEDIFAENNVAPPEHIPHGGTIEDIASKRPVVKHGPWKQEGNMIICTCDIGHHASPIPTSHILTGTDDNGHPILTKVEV